MVSHRSAKKRRISTLNLPSPKTEISKLPKSTKNGLLFGNCSNLEEMPSYLQFNCYIKSGYRKLTNIQGCFYSLLFLHNESTNIITHGPVGIYTLLNWKNFWPWAKLRRNQPYFYGLGIAHTIAMVIPWIPSFFYHLLMSHQNGPTFYSILLRFDMIGIWITEFLGSLTNLAASIWLLPHGIQGALMGAFNVSSIYGLVKALRGSTPRERVICFTPLFIGRLLGSILRWTPFGGGERRSFHHVLLQDITSIIGGWIGVSRIPEKWFIGKFDYFGNSHNIMHFFVILAIYHMNEASNADINWLINQTNKNDTQKYPY